MGKERAAKATMYTILSLPSGGTFRLRDEGLLQNAIQRTVSKWEYENTDTFECAAAHVFELLGRMPLSIEIS